MSKERARRREAREAQLERERAVRRRRVARRERRRAVVRRLTPRWPRRRTGRLARHSRGERAAIVGLTGVAVVAIWSFVDDLALRVVLVVLLLLVLPAAVVIALGRRS
ncbi:hypothetical protein MCAG_01191 [Micromonospora sp. ATCC 39149]|uniref:Uncharacterized protein n=1 Tax=Micromonospora carbonacea TaxID=47853 RepID=A0A7D6CC87_9ACTN|nr:hypothetical protein [Micromonospora sp. ATCC 39149]EEP70864.1 hypothetical protein MCAG_01191 [Micromonospora sp. ATCC 39149]QLJ97203.1 hypothetical protein HZU44_20465 [Micromonospora carbonacea]